MTDLPAIPDPAGTSAVITAVLADRPDVVESLDAAHRAAWAATDPALLELCRVRVAQLVGCDAEAAVSTGAAGPVDADTVRDWARSPRFDARQRAVLAYCEMFVIDVAGLDDATVAAVRDHLGDEGLVDLTNALLVIEQRQRMRCTWERLGLVDRTEEGTTTWALTDRRTDMRTRHE